MKRQPIGEILQGALPAALRQRLFLHAKVLDRIRSVLPEPLGTQCQACVVNDKGQVIIYVPNAACGAQIRFFGDKLLDALRAAEFPALRQVVVRIGPGGGR